MNNTVKTFPIRMSEDFHKAAAEKAQEAGKSLHQFIVDAVAEKVKSDSKQVE